MFLEAGCDWIWVKELESLRSELLVAVESLVILIDMGLLISMGKNLAEQGLSQS